MFFIVVMFALMFCLALLIKTLYERRNVSDTFSVDSTLRQEVLSQYKSSTNHISRQTSIEKKKQIHQRLLSEETATIGQVNEQLELYRMQIVIAQKDTHELYLLKCSVTNIMRFIK